MPTDDREQQTRSDQRPRRRRRAASVLPTLMTLGNDALGGELEAAVASWRADARGVILDHRTGKRTISTVIPAAPIPRRVGHPLHRPQRGIYPAGDLQPG